MHLDLSSGFRFDSGCVYINGDIPLVDFASLPRGLLELILCRLGISGSLEVSDLPPSLLVLDLSTNKIRGSPDFTAFPETMMEIFLHDNPIKGTPDLSKLPHGLERLTLFNTRLTFPSGILPSCVQTLDPSLV